jgi:hypothetical protein
VCAAVGNELHRTEQNADASHCHQETSEKAMNAWVHAGLILAGRLSAGARLPQVLPQGFREEG